MTTILYGVLDTVDGLWIGNEDGPVLYESEDLAKVSARIVGVRLGHSPLRYRARLWQPCEMTKRDTLPTKMDALKALTLLEEGKVL
jgi:hypothetical protein